MCENTLFRSACTDLARSGCRLPGGGRSNLGGPVGLNIHVLYSTDYALEASVDEKEETGSKKVQ